MASISWFSIEIKKCDDVISNQDAQIQKVRDEIARLQENLKDSEEAKVETLKARECYISTLADFKRLNLVEEKSIMLCEKEMRAFSVTNYNIQRRISLPLTPLEHGTHAIYESKNEDGEDVFYMGYIFRPHQREIPILIAYKSFKSDEEALGALRDGVYLL
jgi:hypothetical protein